MNSRPLEVLPQHGIGHAVIELVSKARDDVILVSPYLKLWLHMKRAIKRAQKNGAWVALVTRTVEGNDNPVHRAHALEELNEYGVQLFELERLHAKVYVSESELILTSMNLYSESDKNSWEAGVRMSKACCPEEYSQVLEQVREAISGAKPLNSVHRKRRRESERFGVPGKENEVFRDLLEEAASLPILRTELPSNQLKKRKRHPRAYEQWSPAEDDLLKRFVTRHAPRDLMARALRRNIAAISGRLTRLNLVD